MYLRGEANMNSIFGRIFENQTKNDNLPVTIFFVINMSSLALAI